VSTANNLGTNLTEDQLTYVRPPIAIPPGADRYLKLTVRYTGCQGAGTETVWEGLDLRVRVGGFTRVEHLKFGNHFAFGLKATSTRSC